MDACCYPLEWPGFNLEIFLEKNRSADQSKSFQFELCHDSPRALPPSSAVVQGLNLTENIASFCFNNRPVETMLRK